MTKGEHRRVRLRTLTFALLVTATVALGTAWPAHASNDPLFAKQWGLQVADVPAAWSRSTGAGVRIGIVDTGVHLAQEDLAGKVVESANCINSNGNAAACSGNAQDDNGHGTHVSGIAAANKDNGRGIAGVAPGASLVVAKVLDGNGSGSTADVEAGIRWVVQHGARVVNLSLGDDPIFGSLFSDPAFSQTINDAYNAGAIPVVAAGNQELLFCSAPYGGLNALVVGALGHTGSIAGYSCPIGSAKWGVMAPGGDGNGDANDVLSTIWDKNNPSSTNSYAYLAGTSMATPHVSGMAALLLAEGLSRDAAIQKILGTAVAVPGCSGSTCGHGRIDVTAAVGTGSGGVPAAGGGGGAPAASAGAAAAPKVVKSAPSLGASNGTSTTAAPTTTTTPPGTAAAVPGDNPVVAAGAGPPKAAAAPKGGASGRAGQVALAVGLLGVTGLGAGLALRRLRGGGAL
jgi:subtilisin family serine protease